MSKTSKIIINTDKSKMIINSYKKNLIGGSDSLSNPFPMLYIMPCLYEVAYPDIPSRNYSRNLDNPNKTFNPSCQVSCTNTNTNTNTECNINPNRKLVISKKKIADKVIEIKNTCSNKQGLLENFKLQINSLINIVPQDNNFNNIVIVGHHHKLRALLSLREYYRKIANCCIIKFICSKNSDLGDSLNIKCELISRGFPDKIKKNREYIGYNHQDYDILINKLIKEFRYLIQTKTSDSILGDSLPLMEQLNKGDLNIYFIRHGNAYHNDTIEDTLINQYIFQDYNIDNTNKYDLVNEFNKYLDSKYKHIINNIFGSNLNIEEKKDSLLNKQGTIMAFYAGFRLYMDGVRKDNTIFVTSDQRRTQQTALSMFLYINKEDEKLEGTIMAFYAGLWRNK